MPICAMVGCSRTYRPGEGVRLFSLPKVITTQCKKTEELSSKRRATWLSRINRNMTGKKVEGITVKVCGRHFITGQPSALFDFTHPDWAPTLNLGYEWKKGSEASVSRYVRTQERRRKKSTILPSIHHQGNANNHEDHYVINSNQPVEVEQSLYQQREDVPRAGLHPVTDEITVNEEPFEHSPVPQCSSTVNPCEPSLEEVSPHVIEVVEWKVKNHIGCQADLEHQELEELRRKCHESVTQNTVLADRELAELRAKYADQLQQNTLMSEQLSSMTAKVNSLTTSMEQLQAERDMLVKDNQCLREETRKVKLHLKNVSIDEDSLRDDDEKTKFFTGIPSFKLLQFIYEFVEVGVSHSHRNVLPKFTELVVTLMRLRLGVLEQDLAYRFNVSLSTVSKLCSRWIRVMSASLGELITWPERNVLHKTIPHDFMAVFGDRFTVIIDCFEVFVNRPSSLLPRAETFSIYKSHNTAKFLIGITPQGTVCFVSKAWGGRASDKHITLHSGFLDNLVPGDVVLADRGFDIDEDVGMRQAKIAIPAFTKGKTQLSFDDIKKTREIANIRIHVERMIGFIRRKFRILGSILPYSYLIKPTDYDIPPIDDVIKICCGLVNMCPPIIKNSQPNDLSVGADHPILRLVFREDDEQEEPVFE